MRLEELYGLEKAQQIVTQIPPSETETRLPADSFGNEPQWGVIQLRKGTRRCEQQGDSKKGGMVQHQGTNTQEAVWKLIWKRC
jgi:hypothetical protein